MLKTSSIIYLCFRRPSQATKSIFCFITKSFSSTKSVNLYAEPRPLLQNINKTSIYFSSKLHNTYTTKDSSLLETDEDIQQFPSIDEKKQELYRVVKFLKSKGCTSKDIRDKCFPYINSTHSSYMKAVLLSELHPDITILMPLMSCSLTVLRLAVKQFRIDKELITGFSDRISYLAYHLETPPAQLIPALAKHSSLLTMQFDRLERKMSILRQAEISPKYIVKDLWIFNYKEELLGQRISKAQEAGVELKPWILRCSMRNFKVIIEKNSETQSVLKGTDEISYLAKRLDCSKDYVEYIMDRNRSLKAIAIPKLDKVLNCLYEKGYTPAEVRLFPRVFCSSVQTLNKRFNEFSHEKSTLPTISQLCVPSKKRKNIKDQEISS